MSQGAFGAIVARDLRLAARRRVDALLPIGFFAVAASLFPFGVGSEPNLLRQIAPGVVWVCALLASMMSVQSLYAGDHADGSLEQMLLAPQPAVAVATAKATAHWIITGLPLIVASPVIEPTAMRAPTVKSDGAILVFACKAGSYLKMPRPW